MIYISLYLERAQHLIKLSLSRVYIGRESEFEYEEKRREKKRGKERAILLDKLRSLQFLSGSEMTQFGSRGGHRPYASLPYPPRWFFLCSTTDRENVAKKWFVITSLSYSTCCHFPRKVDLVKILLELSSRGAHTKKLSKRSSQLHLWFYHQLHVNRDSAKSLAVITSSSGYEIRIAR